MAVENQVGRFETGLSVNLIQPFFLYQPSPVSTLAPQFPTPSCRRHFSFLDPSGLLYVSLSFPQCFSVAIFQGRDPLTFLAHLCYSGHGLDPGSAWPGHHYCLGRLGLEVGARSDHPKPACPGAVC